MYFDGMPFLSGSVSAFSFDFTAPGFPHRAGSFSAVSFSIGSPAIVDVKLAVQNKDGTLHVAETSYNINTSGQTALINFGSGTEPGINYWLVAVDPSNSQSYATLGPFSISDRMDSFRPSTSATVSSGEVYQTVPPSLPTSGTRLPGTGSTNSSPTAVPTSLTDANRSTTNGARSSSTPNSNGNDSEGQTKDSPLGTGAVIGISVGGAVGGVILVLIVYHCLFRRKPAAPLGTLPVKINQNNNNYNASSIQPITKDDYSPTITPSVPFSTPHKTNVSNVNQQSSPVAHNQQPSSPVLPQNSHNYSFNVEHNYNYQPTDNNNLYQQQHMYNNNQNQYDYAPYPSHDTMPVPENVPYQESTTQYNQQSYSSYNIQQQQNWSPYGQPQTIQPQTLCTYPLQTAVENAVPNSSEHSKTENIPEEPFSQKFEYEYKTSDKTENNNRHHQKPDNPFHSQKPDDSLAHVQQHSKPHERN